MTKLLMILFCIILSCVTAVVVLITVGVIAEFISILMNGDGGGGKFRF